MVDPEAGFPVPKHPIFEGIPNDGIMGREFGTVVPVEWMEGDVMPEEDLGPAVKIYLYGKGKVILSSLNLIHNLSKDALAEKLLCNLVNYSDQNLPAQLAPEMVDSV